MQQVVYSANTFRARQSEAFSHADAGDRVIIRPRNRRASYLLVPIEEESLIPSPAFLEKIERGMQSVAEGKGHTFTNEEDLRKWLDEL